MIFYKTLLSQAVEKENTEIVKLLLSLDEIDVNILNILKKTAFIPFIIEIFNYI